mgnify:FL=1
MYGSLEVCATYAELITDGFIVEPLCIGAEKHPDLSNVHTVAGDYNLAELEAAMMQSVIISGAVDAWKKHRHLRTVVFASGVKHSQQLVAEFQAAGARAAHVDGDTPPEVRATVGEALRMGDLDVVSNFGVYTEGWDEPCVKCCILLRPTKSLTLYRQMVGRILRPWEKTQPVILDHALSIDRHGMPTEDIEWSIDGKPKRQADSAKFRMCPKCFAYQRAAPKCELCGHVYEVKQRELPREVDAPLVVRTAGPDEKRRFYDEQVEIARRKGFKPGFPSFKVKEKYGDWPPWAWSQATKAAYAADPIWQAGVAKQTERREFWKARQQMGAPVETEADVERHVEESFGDFVARTS